MEYSKQTIIEALEHSIEKTRNEIEKYSKDCNGRFAHREFLKKKLKKLEKQLEEVGMDGNQR